jgi:hypothetical protein
LYDLEGMPVYISDIIFLVCYCIKLFYAAAGSDSHQARTIC